MRERETRAIRIFHIPTESVCLLSNASLSVCSGVQLMVCGSLSEELSQVQSVVSQTSSSDSARRSVELLQEVVLALTQGLVDINYLYNKVGG